MKTENCTGSVSRREVQVRLALVTFLNPKGTRWFAAAGSSGSIGQAGASARRVLFWEGGVYS